MAAPYALWLSLFVFIFIGLLEWIVFTKLKEKRTFVIRIHMLIFFQTGLGLFSRYLWKFSHTKKASPLVVFRAIIPLFNVLLIIGAHSSFLLAFFFTDSEPNFIVYFSFLLLGLYAQSLFCLICINVLHFVLKNVVFTFKRKIVTFNHEIKVLLVFVYTIVICSYGTYCSLQDPIVKSVNIQLQKLGGAFQNFRIVQISDVHLGPTVGQSRFQRVVKQVIELEPDLVVITGDLVDGKVSALKSALRPASQITAHYGIYFVTGNHEYFSGEVDKWFSVLQKLGVTVLHNSNVKIQHKDNPDHQLCLAGTDDVTANMMQYGDHKFDLDQALESCNPKYPTILLAHQPNGAKQALDSKFDVDLVLSGHTHGGQMFPFSIFIYLWNPFFRGLYKYGEHSYVYVNSGTVFWGIPLRIGSSMEITEIILKTTI